jgi:hypothetical protein
MNKPRFLLSTVSALTVAAAGAVLSTPAPAAAAGYFACTGSQIEYVHSVNRSVCGSRGGTTTVICDGASVEIVEVECNPS